MDIATVIGLVCVVLLVAAGVIFYRWYLVPSRTPEPLLVMPTIQFLGQSGWLIITLPEPTPAEHVPAFIEQLRDRIPAERTVVILGADAYVVEQYPEKPSEPLRQLIDDLRGASPV